jgi:hypothetical protein
MLPGALLVGVLIALFASLIWRARPAWHADLLALLALTGVLAVFFAPVLVGGMWLPRGGGDLVSFLWPVYTFAARELRAGRLPLWHPHLYSGAPFIADNQSGVFYPPNLALFLLAPEVTYEPLEWLVIFHFWLAGIGAYLCLRALLPAGRSHLPALFGALAFMLSDVFVTHQGNLNLIAVAAYLPLIFLCTWRALMGTGRAAPLHGFAWALGAGALFGVATLAGHGQMTLLLALTIGAVGLYALLARWREDRRKWSVRFGVVALTALAGLVGAGIAAVSLVPAAELTPHSLRASLGYEDAARFSLPPVALVELLAPGVFGRGPDAFRAPWDRVEVGYAGALALLFALYGARHSKDRRLARFWVIFGALALLMALGEHTPLHRLVYHLPGMGSLRAPARFVLLFDFALAGLAAFGLHAWLTRPRGEGIRRWVVALAVAALLGVLMALSAVPVELAPAVPGVLLAFVLLSAAWALDALRGRFPPARLAMIVIALLAFELIANGAGIEVDSGDPRAGFEHPAVLEWLRAQPGLFRVEGAAPAWQPDAAAFYGLHDIYGVHNPLALAAYDAFYWSVGQRGTPQYNFLGARYVIRPKGDPPASASFARGFTVVFDADPALTVYENARALPLASMVARAVSVERPEDAWDAIHDPGWDPTTVVYVEDGPPLDGTAGDVREGFRVENTLYESDRLVFQVDTPAPAYLVLSEVYYPGWRATVDGAPAQIYRANTAFRAVYISETGHHTVELVFAPQSFTLGAAISAVTLLILLIGGGVLWRRRAGR